MVLFYHDEEKMVGDMVSNTAFSLHGIINIYVAGGGLYTLTGDVESLVVEQILHGSELSATRSYSHD